MEQAGSNQQQPTQADSSQPTARPADGRRKEPGLQYQQEDRGELPPRQLREAFAHMYG